jgi:hypothetical protein
MTSTFAHDLNWLSMSTKCLADFFNDLYAATIPLTAFTQQQHLATLSSATNL